MKSELAWPAVGLKDLKDRVYLDGENGILRYRGYPIEQLADNASFLEVSFLIIYGELPTKTQLESFQESITNVPRLEREAK